MGGERNISTSLCAHWNKHHTQPSLCLCLLIGSNQTRDHMGRDREPSINLKSYTWFLFIKTWSTFTTIITLFIATFARQRLAENEDNWASDTYESVGSIQSTANASTRYYEWNSRNPRFCIPICVVLAERQVPVQTFFSFLSHLISC